MTLEGPVAWITIDNPTRRNAITPSMCQMFAAIAEDLAIRDDVRVVVVRGAGDVAFSAGADITTLRSSGSGDVADMRGIHALVTVDVPVIAMVQGFCLGGGLVRHSPRRRHPSGVG